MKATRVARRYARALMMTADSNAAIDSIAADLELLRSALAASRELRLLLASPVVSVPRKKSILRELFAQRIEATTMTFLELLVEKQREALLADIIQQFFALRDESYGIVNVDVSAAVELTPQQTQRLMEKLERLTSKKVRVRFSLDRALRGGLKVKIGDTVLDASLQHQLEMLREQLAHGHLSN